MPSKRKPRRPLPKKRASNLLTAANERPAEESKKDAGKETPQEPLCPVAGFGASAGGLEAFTEVLLHLPDDAGMAFVLVQHLDPERRSLLTELLAKSTSMPVIQVKDGMRAERNRVYVIPPNANMIISQGVLKLEPRFGHHMPIDHFFRSLAQDQSSKAIGVILSGTASDGTLGLKAIKAEGGITFAQDESTAKYDGMPRSAILAGCVDFILPPEGIARELVRLCRHPYVAPAKSEEETHPEADQQVAQIFTMLRNATGVDFSYYKHATVRWRIMRRMALFKMQSLEQYTNHVKRNPGELQSLFQDILINVTGFFREPLTFEAMEKKVLPAIFKDRQPEDSVRVWVPGCATGEEAYSVAICMIEYMREHDLDVGIQIFGTDLSEASLEAARAGIYPENISADVSSERLRRFFTKVNGSYQITRSIRDMCIFARQNLTKDPPFSKLDLISCRNVLIYLGPVLQSKAFRFFHYALKPDGFLVLGLSETVGGNTEVFAHVDGKEKIYTKKAAAAGTNLDFGSFEEAHAPLGLRRLADWTSGPDLQRKVDQMILARHSPAGVLVDEELKVLQFRGHTAPYLEHTAGAPSLSLLKMTRGGAGLEIRKLVQRVKKTGTSVTSEPIRIALNDSVRPVRLAVTPIKGAESRDLAYLILFEEAPVKAAKAPPGKRRAAETDAEARIRELEQELTATKQYLQSVVEEQEAASEELKSAHEEVQSSNEELQSANEELLTSKEELQSANEELTTVNEEMQGRNGELTQINGDLNNLLSSVNIPIVMLGNDLRIRRFTPLAEKVLSLLPTDVGRKITDFRIKLNIPDLEAQFIDVIDNLQLREREVQDQDGRTYMMSIRPYRTVENKIDGAVMTLYDITDRRQAAEIRYRRLFESARYGIIILETKTGEILDVNPFITRLCGYARQQLVGQRIGETELFRSAGVSVGSLQQMEAGESLQQTLTLRTKSGDQIEVEMIGNAYEEGQKQVVQLNIRDVSARKKQEENLRRNEEQHRQAEKMEAIGRLSGGVAHEFNNLLTAIVGYSDLLKMRVGGDEPLQEDLEQIRKAADRATGLTRQLLTFGRKQVLQPVILDLNVVLNEIQQMVHVMISDRVELVRVNHPDLGLVKADRGQIEQVITNLVLNARDAMPDGGKITIETAMQRVDVAFSRAHPTVPPGDFVVLSVSDNGTGMDPETQAHLFEPFFTTKPKGLGTGLGLSTIHEIVKQSGGHIWAYSELGQGTTFKIYLPRVEGKAAAEPRSQPHEQPRGSETILLVEDEPVVRRLAQTILQEAGYRVLEAANGPEAMRIAKEHQSRIHLLLTDVVMPHMSGREVADRLKAQRRDTRILFMSGHSEDAVVNHGVLEEGFAFLPKPFTPEGLSRKVRQVLEGAKKTRKA